jgi:hypothetical protein
MQKRYPIKKNRKRMLKYGVVALAVLVLSVVILTLLFPSSSTPYYPNPNTFYFKAAIVDEESLTDSNPAFVQNATTTLQKGGFTVDYIKAADATVDFYKNLPTYDYGIIILRVHSTVLPGSGWVSICTSENYSSQKYVWEQLDDELLRTKVTGTSEEIFSLGPNFKMNGHFQNTVIIMMGCDGLGINGTHVYLGFAKMLVNNGAKAYVGWSWGVTASASDNVTQQLLQNLIVKRTTLEEAINSTPTDPGTGAYLRGYPNSESSFVIPQQSPQSNPTSGTTATTGIYVNDAFSQNHKSSSKIRIRFS